MINPEMLYNEWKDDEKKWWTIANDMSTNILLATQDEMITPAQMQVNNEAIGKMRLAVDKFISEITQAYPNDKNDEKEDLKLEATKDVGLYNQMINIYTTAQDQYTKRRMEILMQEPIPILKKTSEDFKNSVFEMLAKKINNEALILNLKDYSAYRLMHNNLDKKIYQYITQNDVINYFNTVIDREIPYFKNKNFIVKLLNEQNEQYDADENLITLFEDEYGREPTNDELAQLRGHLNVPKIRENFIDKNDPNHLLHYLRPNEIDPSSTDQSSESPSDPYSSSTPPSSWYDSYYSNSSIPSWSDLLAPSSSSSSANSQDFFTPRAKELFNEYEKQRKYEEQRRKQIIDSMRNTVLESQKILENQRKGLRNTSARDYYDGEF